MNIPEHIAIIMDGNGRWAKKYFLPRFKGHQAGIKTVREMVKHCIRLGVKVLTLFAFSSENKNRSNKEVSLLFKLFLNALQQDAEKLNERNVRLKIIGDMSFFPDKIQQTVVDVEQLLAHNTALTLIIAANYSGQWDIAQSSKKIAEDVISGNIKTKEINVENFSKYLSLADEPDVDLLIRTSGELRVSNFLLWDIAYSELYFTNTLWPDFNSEALDKAIESFNNRERRFGVRKGKSC